MTRSHVIPTAAGQPTIEIPIKTHTGYHLDWADEDRKIAVRDDREWRFSS